ncbi:hypothetical protein PoB_002938700 [Plakobranchus ocellatus]|uniref:Uncharacterized protein n=1 Tax=Plakobranchus ocellatus TaxID=259542 RepID=A0AAV4A7J2_9GAST|nr:hypothetical protein PoB_002938700 [Plakobranchus ocellatus]
MGELDIVPLWLKDPNNIGQEWPRYEHWGFFFYVVNGGISKQAIFVPNHFVPTSPAVFCHSNDDLYDDKTLAKLDPVIISTYEPTASESERYDIFPLKTLNVHQLQKRLYRLGKKPFNEENKVESEDSLSDLEMMKKIVRLLLMVLSTGLNHSETSSKNHLEGEKPGPVITLEQETNKLNLFMRFSGELP